jgi:hypothetical protein
VYLDIACRACLILVFVVAAFGKLRSRTEFRAFAESLRPLGADRAAGAVAAAEIATIALLALPSGWGYVAAVAMLATFVAGIARLVRSEQRVTCNCFGTGGRELGRPHLIRNCLLSLVAVAGLAADLLTEIRLDSVPVAAIAAAGGAVISLIFIRWDDLSFLLSPG